MAFDVSVRRRVGATGASATLTGTIEEISVLAELPAIEISLAAGRWRVNAVVRAKPDDAAPPEACWDRLLGAVARPVAAAGR